MKLQITDDFRKAAKGMLIYFVCACVMFPVYHLIKGDLCWEDVLSVWGINAAVCVVVGLFFFLGMQVPAPPTKVPEQQHGDAPEQQKTAAKPGDVPSNKNQPCQKSM